MKNIIEKYINKISYGGVSKQMPIFQQKSIVLFNRLAFILIFMILFSSGFMFRFMEMTYVPVAFLFTIPILLLNLWLNKLGKLKLSVLIFSVFFPIFFTWTSVFSKLNGEGASLIYFIAPRFGVLISVIFPILIFGVNDKKTTIITTLPAFLLFIFFDIIHKWAGISINNIHYLEENYKFVVIGLSIVLIFAIVMISFLQSINTTYEKIVLEQKQEIIEGRDVALQQRDEISKVQKHITDSISYARKIQDAVLPTPEIFKEFSSGYFIYNKPKDIVSGDFYFIEKHKKNYYFAVADCTGHGVPGALMSMLGISFLQQIIHKTEPPRFYLPAFAERISKKIPVNFTKDPLNAAEILDLLRIQVKISLKQTDFNSERKEGMDISFCIYNSENNEIDYAGAYNPLLIVNNNTSKLITADRMPIGSYKKEHPFTNHRFRIEKGDKLYLYSDGFQDQFGGDTMKKYSSKSFRQFLTDISNFKMEKQHEMLEEEYKMWRKTREQIDDVMVLGIEF